MTMPTSENESGAGEDRRCRYCQTFDLTSHPSLRGDSTGWSDADLKFGHRTERGVKVYHCYAGYVED